MFPHALALGEFGFGADLLAVVLQDRCLKPQVQDSGGLHALSPVPFSEDPRFM